LAASNPVNIALPKYLDARRAAMARRCLPSSVLSMRHSLASCRPTDSRPLSPTFRTLELQIDMIDSCPSFIALLEWQEDLVWDKAVGHRSF
jgi:hypothetical protein